MADTVTLVGGGGTEFVFDLPLSDVMADQLARRQLVPKTPEDRAKVLDSDVPAGDDVPEGTVGAVLDWVGDDKERAAAALAVEQDQSKPRVSLTGALEELIGG